MVQFKWCKTLLKYYFDFWVIFVLLFFYDKNIQKRKTLKILTKKRDKNKKMFLHLWQNLLKLLISYFSVVCLNVFLLTAVILIFKIVWLIRSAFNVMSMTFDSDLDI